MVKVRDEVLAARFVSGAYNVALELATQVSGGVRQVTVRDMTPQDLGAAGMDWSQPAPGAAGWNTIYSGTVPTSKAYVIYGFADLDANSPITAVRITVGSNLSRMIVLQDIHDGALYGRRVFLTFDDQVGIRESISYKIDAYYNAAAASKLVVLGFVGEPAGDTIQKVSKPITIAGEVSMPKVTTPKQG